MTPFVLKCWCQGAQWTILENLGPQCILFFFAQLAIAENMAAFCLTEPSSGSDAGVWILIH